MHLTVAAKVFSEASEEDFVAKVVAKVHAHMYTFAYLYVYVSFCKYYWVIFRESLADEGEQGPTSCKQNYH